MRLVVLALVATALAAPSAQAADGESCQGKPATIVQTSGQIRGTDGDDVIVAGADVDQVVADEGNDTVCVTAIGSNASGRNRAVSGGPGDDSVEARGGDGRDFVRLEDFEAVDVDMGAGKDHVKLGWNETPEQLAGWVNGGAAADQIDAYAVDVVVGLARGKLSLTIDAWLSLSGFENAAAVAKGGRARVIGDAGDNILYIGGCDVAAIGGAGDDTIGYASSGGGPSCQGVTMFGNSGNDELYGSKRDDRLIGGPGFDRADGFKGTDRCVAEKRADCER